MARPKRELTETANGVETLNGVPISLISPGLPFVIVESIDRQFREALDRGDPLSDAQAAIVRGLMEQASQFTRKGYPLQAETFVSMGQRVLEALALDADEVSKR